MTLTISIHAPAKGATITSWHHTHIVAVRFQSTLPRRERLQTAAARCLAKRISIHAPAKGATLTAVAVSCCTQNFNPRSREGSDIIRLGLDVDKTISIHAPAKGATLPIRWRSAFAEFQSTLPRRERQIIYAARWKRYGFQSTLPRRERQISAQKMMLIQISIHAPAKGATIFQKQICHFFCISIHAPAKGATV